MKLAIVGRKNHPKRMTKEPLPAELRKIFGANLKYLSQSSASISQLCREIGVNRTQFNRYLNGDSFPRPDVLHKICKHFDVDARILLEPIRDLLPKQHSFFQNYELRKFVGARALEVGEDRLPSGLFRMTLSGYQDRSNYFMNLVLIYRKEHTTFIRGYESKDALQRQGLDTGKDSREFRGLISAQDAGFAIMQSRRGAVTTSFIYIERAPAYENNFWAGFSIRTWATGAPSYRMVPIVFEFLGKNLSAAKSTARLRGTISRDKLLPYHLELLRERSTQISSMSHKI